jgi:hypothetical protein
MKMKAILIDPEARTVTLVEHEGDYRNILKTIEVELFTCVKLDEKNILFVDDEGLLHDPRYFFEIANYPQPLAGKGLILGTTDDGDSTDATLTLEQVKSAVRFRELKVEGFQHGTYTEKDGSRVIWNQPVLSQREPENETES